MTSRSSHSSHSSALGGVRIRPYNPVGVLGRPAGTKSAPEVADWLGVLCFALLVPSVFVEVEILGRPFVADVGHRAAEEALALALRNESPDPLKGALRSRIGLGGEPSPLTGLGLSLSVEARACLGPGKPIEDVDRRWRIAPRRKVLTFRIVKPRGKGGLKPSAVSSVAHVGSSAFAVNTSAAMFSSGPPASPSAPASTRPGEEPGEGLLAN